MKNWLIVIPARLHSTRLHQKPLQDLWGKPLIVRVAENLKPLAERGAQVVVATDDDAVAQAVRQHGFEAEMTATTHESGTDRCYEVATRYHQPFVMNVQGDEPNILCDDLVKLATALEAQAECSIGTLKYPCSGSEELRNPNSVKVVCDTEGRALYFSRAAIPYPSDSWESPVPSFDRHIGVYAFQRAGLSRFCALKPSLLERTEKLEQLRALENGLRILVVSAKGDAQGIDTPEDLAAARRNLAAKYQC